MNIFGLGKAGCKIAELFKQQPQYNVTLFDSDKKYVRRKNCVYVKKQPSAELYDSTEIKMKIDIEGDKIIMIVCGSGAIAAATLQILSNFKQKDICLYYICSDVNTISAKAKLRNRAHFGILQEYARSGVFQKIFLIDNLNMKDIIGSVPVLQHYSKINNMIFSVIHMLNVFENTEPVFDTLQDDLVTCRISTLSMLDMESKTEKDFFSLKNVNQIKYFYGINRLRIEKDEKLLDEVVSLSTLQSHDLCVTSYAIYDTDYDYDFCYVIKSTADIQYMEG